MKIPKGWPTCLTNHNHGEDWLREDFELDLRTTLAMVQSYRVAKMTHYKQHADWGHEFVIVAFEDPSPSQDDEDAAADTTTDRKPLMKMLGMGSSGKGSVKRKGSTKGKGPGRMETEERKEQQKLLYLKYERDWQTAEEYRKKIKGTLEGLSTTSSVALNRSELRKDLITWMSAKDVKARIEEDRKVYCLKEMTFPGNGPTILDVAVVLEAHSVLSPEYRLYATMCYWYAGSTWQIMRDIFNGVVEDDPKHSAKAGKYKGVPAYSEVREKQDAHAIATLASAVGEELTLSSSEILTPQEREAQAKIELEKIPTYATLLREFHERKARALKVITTRDEAQRAQAQAVEGQKVLQTALDTANVALEAEQAAREAEKAALEAVEAELKQLRERIAAMEAGAATSSSA